MVLDSLGIAKRCWFYIACAIVFHIVLLVISPDQPLRGPHILRQADTLYSSYSYCFEHSDFLKPRILQRGITEGVAVGEFPIYNYIMSLPCKVSGIWSVSLIRAIDFLIYIINFFLLGCALKIFWKKLSWEWLTLFWFFTPLWFVYIPMPIPDGFALMLFLSCWCWSQRKTHPAQTLLQDFLLVLIFLIRPYFFPLFFLVRGDLKHFAKVTVLCSVAYLVWFKWWVSRVTDIFYYDVASKPLSELLTNWWTVISSIVEQSLYHHLNYLGLILFVSAIFKERRLFLCWVGSWIFILLVKADHFVNHPYYMISAAFFAMLLLLRSDFFENIGTKFKVIFASLYVLICISSVQHHYFMKREWVYDAGEQVRAQTKFSERIATYGNHSVLFLFSAMRTGWIIPYDDFYDGTNCPEGATWAWQIDEHTKTSNLVRCVKLEK